MFSPILFKNDKTAFPAVFFSGLTGINSDFIPDTVINNFLDSLNSKLTSSYGSLIDKPRQSNPQEILAIEAFALILILFFMIF